MSAWGSPQESDCLANQALKARFKPGWIRAVLEVNRAISAGRFEEHPESWGAAPGLDVSTLGATDIPSELDDPANCSCNTAC